MAGKLLIIAGAGPGISLATARRFGTEGYAVALIGRRQEALLASQRELQNAGVNALFQVADCAREAELSAAIQAFQAEAGPADALLYNAANLKWKNLLEETAGELIADFAVNVAGALTAVQAVLPTMRAANHGTLIFTGSSFAEHPVSSFGSLSIGKAGLRNFSHSLAKALGETAINVHYLNINGRVTVDDPTRSPQQIAERCWQLHLAGNQPAGGAPAPVDVTI